MADSETAPELPEGYRGVKLPSGEWGAYPKDMPETAIRLHIRQKFPATAWEGAKVGAKGLWKTLNSPVGSEPGILKSLFDVGGKMDVGAGLKTPEEAEERSQMGANLAPLAAGTAAGGALLRGPIQAATRFGPKVASALGAMLGGSGTRAVQEPEPGMNRLESAARTAAEIGAAEVLTPLGARLLGRMFSPLSNAPKVTTSTSQWTRQPIGSQLPTQPGARIAAEQTSRSGVSARMAAGGGRPIEAEAAGASELENMLQAGVWKESTRPVMGQNVPDVIQGGTVSRSYPKVVVRDPSRAVQSGIDTATQVPEARDTAETAGGLSLMRLLRRFLPMGGSQDTRGITRGG